MSASSSSTASAPSSLAAAPAAAASSRAAGSAAEVPSRESRDQSATTGAEGRSTATTTSTATSPAPASPFALTAARFRLAILVLIGVYPLITGLSYGVGLFTATWPIWQRGLVLTPLMVTAMVFGLIPFIQFRFGRFIATGRW